MLYVRVSCFVVCGYAVAKGHIDVCNCDVFSIVNVYVDHLKLFNSVDIDLKYNEISLTFTTGSVCLCGVCSHVVILGLSVRLSWYPCGGCGDCDS